MIGDSGGGLALLEDPAASRSAQTHDHLIARYRIPQPRVTLAAMLRDASAAIDVSDGLLADLGHLAEASSVRIVVQAQDIPRSPALRSLWGDSVEAIVRAATAGDDYEIAFAASGPASDGQTPVACIGSVEKGSGVVLLDADGREIAVPRKGFTHF
jgi:thiamine-monophosphate kinase